MKIVRTITYEGLEERLLHQLEKSLADGTHTLGHVRITVSTETKTDIIGHVHFPGRQPCGDEPSSS